MKKSEVIDSYRRKFDSLIKEFKFLETETCGFRVFLKNEEGIKLKNHCISLSQKIEDLRILLIDLNRIHSLE